MQPLLLGLSSEYLYFKHNIIEPISDYHHPYFLAFTGQQTNCHTARERLIDIWQRNKETSTPLSYITKIGELETYRSFWEFGKTFDAFKVFTSESYRVPEVSDHIFFNHGLYTGEHDIPYQQRALLDLQASGQTWLFDSRGKKEKLRMLVYDIELTQFELGKIDSPIDMIGYAATDILFESSKNIQEEKFQFDILDIPERIEEKDVVQLMARNVDEEIDNLTTFCKLVTEYDIISGHNIIGFDNRQIYGRIQTLLKQNRSQMGQKEIELFGTFLSKYSRVDRSFHFGISSDIVQIYPCSFDTYLASRKFYPYLDSHSLKAVAPFLGVGEKDRLILGPSEIKLDARTLKYNRQDVLEQMGVTLHLIQLTLPLAFTTGMSFDMLLDSGAVNMWDHMSLIRGAVQKKLIPATCRVSSITQNLTRDFKGCRTKTDIVSQAKNQREQLSKDFVRVVKYGSEMPNWMLYPYVIYNEHAKDVDDRLNYHMPGGMTIKPDKDAVSHFIPWYKVIVADVGAMYPTILKALNIGADTVCLCPKNEKPDEWIWLKKLPSQFFDEQDVNWRKISKEDRYADKGFMIGVKIDKEAGVVNCAMTGIMSMIARIKDELKQVSTKGNTDELSRLKMMYQSVKGARNAGSVDYSQRIVLVSPDGNYEPVKIGEFVDGKLKEKGIIKEVINGTEFEIATVTDGWKAVSVNAYGKTELKMIKQVVRHRYDGDLLKISTKSGSTVVTPNHSIFTISDNSIKEISAEDLKDDSLVAHVRNVPETEQKDTPKFSNENMKELADCFAIQPKKIQRVAPTSEYVYDISVEDNENFIDADGGIILHNTHGILSAPNVSGRQFNLWAAATITTKGQDILAETLDFLEKKGIRVVYADTDGIYMGCSNSVKTIPKFSKAVGITLDTPSNKWLTSPEDAIAAIDASNVMWQKELSYADFELEPEFHDAMIFVKHKNYLIFDEKQGSIEMTTKGNNFKGSDKADIARKALKEIMIRVLKENPEWTEEDTAREEVKESIMRITQEVVAKFDLSKVDIADLTLIQQVKPANRYKRNQDGSLSTFGKRAAALEKVLGEPLRTSAKFRFVVTKKPLPGITNPSKSGVKPIDYMYPVDKIRDAHEIDLDWYKQMIENYIQGAFGLSQMQKTEQTGLDAWM
jgi:DNA polymerase elongation subunit (family B)